MHCLTELFHCSEEAMRKAGTAHSKSSNDMETHVFTKAKSREEYLSLVARLIIHFRDIRKYIFILVQLSMQMVQQQQQQQQQSIQFQQFQAQQQTTMQAQPPTAMQQNALQQQQFQAQQLKLQQQLQQQQQQQQQHPSQALQHQNQQQQAQAQQQQAQAQQQQQQNQVRKDYMRYNECYWHNRSGVIGAELRMSSDGGDEAFVSFSSGPTPSPGGFQPSPSPQPSQSPATARTPQNYPLQVPSPGPLNTPGNPSSVMSPAGSSQSEDQLYMDTLKQLSKYIEPLRRMINKIDKNEDRKKDLSKMKSLLNILTDPNTRCPLKTLQKCEIALEKLKNDMAVPTPPPPPVPCTKKQYLCQPLLDAVLANIRSPVFNHSLYRTFAPAMTAIHGPPIIGPIIPTRKRKYEEDDRQTIPNILQGEVARLSSKFLVNLDPSFCSNNGTVHLICKLDDKNLPSVPPLQLSIPADYPDQSPQWDNDSQQYEANPFLQTVHKTMTSKLLQLPDKHSVTALLNTWAQSVRQTCLSAA
uniref:Mediator of RNA polymerase II transcription subunit 15 n=1 Tax=Electrophorus electricus TaxID=8005 RepID=A0A4W4G3A4_ELEEL